MQVAADLEPARLFKPAGPHRFEAGRPDQPLDFHAGAVVVVVKDGQILTARGFGYADVKNAKPVDPERTLFRPGSVSNPRMVILQGP